MREDNDELKRLMCDVDVMITVLFTTTVQLTKAFPSLKSWGRKRVVRCTVLYRI